MVINYWQKSYHLVWKKWAYFGVYIYINVEARVFGELVHVVDSIMHMQYVKIQIHDRFQIWRKRLLVEGLLSLNN